MVDKETLNKIIEKKVLWEEINAKEREYNRIQQQINTLRDDQTALKHNIIIKLKQSQTISEWLLEKEYESLKQL